MLYYNGNLLDVSAINCKNKPEGDVEGDTYRQIEELRSQHFAKDKKGVVQLRYPNGILKKHNNRGTSGKKTMTYEPKKIFFISLKSRDGMWQWSDRRADVNGVNTHNHNKFKVSDPWLFYEKDIDLIWFIQNHCPQTANGSVYFEDPEAVAQKESKEIFDDIELKYMLSAKRSPLANNLELLRSVAGAFDIEGSDRMGKFELRQHIFNVVSEGEKKNNKYINADKLQMLTDNEAKMKAIDVVRKHINMGVIKWYGKEKAWYVFDGDEPTDELLKIKAVDLSNKTNILFDKIVSDSMFKGKVYSELGLNDFQSKAEVKELGRPALISMCSQNNIPYESKDKLDDLVEKYCKKMGIA